MNEPGETGNDRRGTGRRGVALILASVLALALVLVVAGSVLFVRGGIRDPAARARADAERGHARLAPELEAEEQRRQAALEPVLGEPIEQTWYVVCAGVEPGFLFPASQSCRLSVTTTYEMSWDDPPARVDGALRALEATDASVGRPGADGSGWERTAVASEDHPVGRVAQVGVSGGSVHVREPGAEILLGDTVVLGPYPDGVIRRDAREKRAPASDRATMEIRRTVGISQTLLGCIPDRTLTCRTPLQEAAMPQLEGYRD